MSLLAKWLKRGTPVSIGSANAQGTSDSVALSDHVHAHGAQAGGTTHAMAVSGGAAGFLAGTDKAKLDGIASGATANAPSSATPAPLGTAAAGSAAPYARGDHVHAHGAQTDPAHHAIAVPNGDAGFMSGEQALKLLYVPYLAGSAAMTLGTVSTPGTSTTHCSAFDHVHAHGSQADPSMHLVATPSANGFMPATDKAKIDALGPYTSDPAALGAAAQGASVLYARGDHVHAHGDQSAPSLHALATPLAHGFMSAADKTLLNLYAAEALVQNQSPLILRPLLAPAGGSPVGMQNGMAYCIYIGYTTKSITVNNTRFCQSSAGAGTDSGCQMGFGSSPAGPSFSSFATITPLAIAAVPSPLSAGNKTNAAAFAVNVPAGTHLWAILKSAMSMTQLGAYPILGDVTGSVQSRASVGTIAVSTPIVCTAYQVSAPDLTLVAV